MTNSENNKDLLYLLSGYKQNTNNESKVYSDIWTFNIKTLEWNEIFPKKYFDLLNSSEESILMSESSSVIFYGSHSTTRNKKSILFFFGGVNNNKFLGNLRMYNIDANILYEIDNKIYPGNTPSERKGHTLVKYSDGLILYGGMNLIPSTNPKCNDQKYLNVKNIIERKVEFLKTNDQCYNDFLSFENLVLSI